MSAETFTEDYYLRGPETGLSNYENYRWLPQATIPVCKLIMRYLGGASGINFPTVGGPATITISGMEFRKGDSVLDYGCARGYYVKALRGLGFDAWGYDISKWAIANCDEEVKPFLSDSLPIRAFDFLLCKDVLEHIPYKELPRVINYFIEATLNSALIIVPLARDERGWKDGDGTSQIKWESVRLTTSARQYVSPIDQSDSTHKICWTLPEWLLAIQAVIDASGRAFTVSGGFKMPGVKRAADPYPQSCGFVLLKRFEYE